MLASLAPHRVTVDTMCEFLTGEPSTPEKGGSWVCHVLLAREADISCERFPRLLVDQMDSMESEFSCMSSSRWRFLEIRCYGRVTAIHNFFSKDASRSLLRG